MTCRCSDDRQVLSFVQSASRTDLISRVEVRCDQTLMGPLATPVSGHSRTGPGTVPRARPARWYRQPGLGACGRCAPMPAAQTGGGCPEPSAVRERWPRVVCGCVHGKHRRRCSVCSVSGTGASGARRFWSATTTRSPCYVIGSDTTAYCIVVYG